MTKKYFQTIGSNIAIGFDGSPRDIQQMYYSMWNLKATTGELQMLTDNFGYVLTTKPKFEKYLFDSSERILYNQTQVEPTLDAIEALVETRRSEFVQETFIKTNDYSNIEYKIGSIEKE